MCIADLDSAEVFGGAGDGIYEGQECHAQSAGVGGPAEEFCGPAFLSAWILVSMVGKDEAGVRRYIQEQEKEDQRLDQLELGGLGAL